MSMSKAQKIKEFRKSPCLDEFPPKSLGARCMRVRAAPGSGVAWEGVSVMFSGVAALKTRETTTKDGKPKESKDAYLKIRPKPGNRESGKLRMNCFLKFAYIITSLPGYEMLQEMRDKRPLLVASFCNGPDDGFLRACEHLFGSKCLRASSYGSVSAVAGPDYSYTGDFLSRSPFDDPTYKDGKKLASYDLVLIDPALNEGEMLEQQEIPNLQQKRAQLASNNADYVLSFFMSDWHLYLEPAIYIIKVRQYNSVDLLYTMDGILRNDGYVAVGVIHDDLSDKLEFFLVYRKSKMESEVDMAASLVAALDVWLNAYQDGGKHIRYPCWLSWEDIEKFLTKHFGRVDRPWSPSQVKYTKRSGPKSINIDLHLRKSIPIPLSLEDAAPVRN